MVPRHHGHARETPPHHCGRERALGAVAAGEALGQRASTGLPKHPRLVRAATTREASLFLFMETAAAVRKARIVALRELKQAEEAGDEAAISANVFGQRVKRHFRSSMPPAALLPQGDEAAVSTVENEVRDMQESVMAEDTRKQAEELDLANIAPRRPNWDLRRDLDARLALLEPRTEEAIHTLIVRRLGASRDRQEDVANVLANE